MTPNLGISMSDYQGAGADGLLEGSSSADQLDNLNKALTAGTITGRETTGLTNVGSQSLKLESLDANLKTLTFKEGQLELYKWVPKMAAYNTVEEYNQLLSYGADGGGFISETELPAVADSVYTRGMELIKFMGVQGEVSLAAQMVKNNVGNLYQTEIRNKMIYLLHKVNRALAFADSEVATKEFNGIYAQHQRQFGSLDIEAASDSVLDLRGAVLTQAHFETASQGIINNFGFGDTIFLDPKTKADFGITHFANQRFPMTNGQGGFAGTVGTVPSEVNTSGGSVKMIQDVFLDTSRAARTLASAQIGTGPATPSAPTVTTPATTGSLFGAGDAGNYIYAVAAVGPNGESALLDLGGGAVIAVAAGDGTDITFTDGDATTTGYKIYRSEKGATFGTAVPLYPIISISKAAKVAGYDGGAANHIIDKNRTIAGTRKAFMIQNDMDVWTIKQLAPMFKLDLPRLAQSDRFMVLAYLNLTCFALRKITVIKNIAR
jgi:hypothetical protein